MEWLARRGSCKLPDAKQFKLFLYYFTGCISRVSTSVRLGTVSVVFVEDVENDNKSVGTQRLHVLPLKSTRSALRRFVGRWVALFAQK